MYIHPKAFIRSTRYFTTCPRLFSNILWILWEHSPECLAIFPVMLFPAMFEDIPWNVLRTFPGMFEDIPRNIWGHSPEYNFQPIPRVSHIPFPVPVFLVLYIAYCWAYSDYLLFLYCFSYDLHSYVSMFQATCGNIYAIFRHWVLILRIPSKTINTQKQSSSGVL